MTPVARLPLRMRGGFHRAGEIDAGDHRKTANDGRFAGDRESVLVIHGGPFDADGDIAFHQIGFVEIGEVTFCPPSLFSTTIAVNVGTHPLHSYPRKAVPCGTGRRNSLGSASLSPESCA